MKLELTEKSAELQIAFEAIVKFGKANVIDDVYVGNQEGVPSQSSTFCAPSTVSNNFEGALGDMKEMYLVNDFQIGAHTKLNVQQLKFNILKQGNIDNFDVYFYNSALNGSPGDLVSSFQGLNPISTTDLHESQGFTRKT